MNEDSGLLKQSGQRRLVLVNSKTLASLIACQCHPKCGVMNHTLRPERLPVPPNQVQVVGRMTAMVEYETKSVAETEAVAAGLARALGPGSVIALGGNLGAGKTQFVRGLSVGLGGNTRSVSSPTYVLLNIYDGGRMPLYHLDAYRVTGAQDFEAIGFEELLEQGGVVVVEWASRVAELLPAETIWVEIEATGETSRRIRIEPEIPGMLKRE